MLKVPIREFENATGIDDGDVRERAKDWERFPGGNVAVVNITWFGKFKNQNGCSRHAASSF